MTIAVPRNAAAIYDDANCIPPLQEGDIVRSGDSPDDCKVLSAWSDWVWLYSLNSGSVAPFTARVRDYDLIKHAEAPRWPYR